MAFTHGIEATLKIGSTQFEGYVDGVEMQANRDEAEIKPIGSKAVYRVLGLEDFSFTVDGAFDATADAAIWTLFKTPPGTVTFKPDGVVEYEVDCVLPQYNIRTGSTAAATWSIRLASTGEMTRTS